MSAESLGIWLVFLLALDLFSVSANAALTYARPSRLQSDGENHSRVTAAADMLGNPAAYLALRLGQAVLHLLFAGAFVLWARNWWPWSLLGWALILAVGFALVALEFLMSGAIARQPETWILNLYGAIRIWVALFLPLTWLLLKMLPAESLSAFQPVMTEEDLKDWVASDNEEGGLQEEERRMIYSIFQFGETLAREIMVPRIDVTALDVDTPLSDAMQTVISSGHSRVPVYEETVDNIIGLLYAKDLLLIHTETLSSVSLSALLRPAYFVPETKKVDELLAEMQTQRIHMAIVVDEYGGFAGLVTLEDIVEEIVGEILDEYDQTEEQPFVQVGSQEYIFLGQISLDDFNEVMQEDLTDEEADTLGGYLYDQLGRVPAEGETLDVGDLRLTIEQVNGRRIRRVRARKVAAMEATNHEKDERTER